MFFDLLGAGIPSNLGVYFMLVELKEGFDYKVLKAPILWQWEIGARLGNANAVTDVGVAGLLASAAAKGAVFNVEINLQSLPEDYATKMRTALPQMKETIRAASREVMDAVRDRMAD